MKVRYYRTQNGRSPFKEWFYSLKDVTGIFKIEKRLDRVKHGNLGDHETVGNGVIELRIDYGPGYRLYCGRKGKQLIILLCGGDKSTQKKDIKKAKEYWDDYNTD